MKHTITTTVLLASLVLLTACSKSADDSDNPVERTITAIDIDEPALGTDVSDVVKRTGSLEEAKAKGYEDVEWDDLLPEGYDPVSILARYQAEIDDAPEGSKAERVLYEKVMGEFNNAGANQSLSGKTIRIPGYVAPLETNGNLVNEFLLVPYYGSCIHTPPPPAHQTVMVNPDKGIPVSSLHRPVWVVGEIVVDQVVTELALAGYQIKNARVEPYVQPSY
jgi:hypothetical protein